MAVPVTRTWVAGEVVTAALLNTYVRDPLNYFLNLWPFALKTSDESVNNSTTLQNDDQLALTFPDANTKWGFELYAILNSGTTPDWKGAFTVPSGATMSFSGHITSSGGTGSDLNGPYTQASTLALATQGADQILRLQGLIQIGATTGVVQLQWAQNTANASNTTVKTNSYFASQRRA